MSDDPFARLGMPRRPQPDPDTLATRFRELGAQAHPDANGGTGGEFAEVNHAYSLLRDPASRLRELARLEGMPAGDRARQVPAGLEELFVEVGETTRQLDDFLCRKQAAQGELGKALLADEEMAMQELGQTRLAEIRAIRAGLDAALAHAENAWDSDRAALLPQLPELADAFGYVSRWQQQLDERLLRLLL